MSPHGATCGSSSTGPANPGPDSAQRALRSAQQPRKSARRGLRFSLSLIGEREWRVYFMRSPMLAPEGSGETTTPKGHVERAAWAAIGAGPQ